MNTVRVENLAKTYASTYRSPKETVPVFDHVNFEVGEGERVALVGESGAGKSTLLHLLGALDTPTGGTIYFGRALLSEFTGSERARYRNETVGYVWQSHNLLPEFTAIENVMMPLRISGARPGPARARARELLEETGMGECAERRVGEISGGEQQRVALARALVRRPSLLLADEPTGNLDFRTAQQVTEVLERLHATHRFMSVLATHNLELAKRSDRIFSLANGKLTEVQTSQLESERD